MVLLLRMYHIAKCAFRQEGDTVRPAGQPPAYDFEIAAGAPELWNDHDRMQVVSWNRRTKQLFTDEPPATIDIEKFMFFFAFATRA